MTHSLNLTEARDFLILLIRQAGAKLHLSYTSSRLRTRSKGKFDFATQADDEVDAFLREKIGRVYPSTTFLTEETAPSDYSSLVSASDLWVIDPLDGTVNFPRRDPNFAISIAFVQKGVPVLGVIYFPMLDELFWAQAGEPHAYRNGKPIHVSHVSKFSETILMTDWSWDPEKRPLVTEILSRAVTQLRYVKISGSAVYGLTRVAMGAADAYVCPAVKPWDVAAAGFVVAKAGGKVSTFVGEPMYVFAPDFLATNRLLHHRMQRML